MEQKRIRLRKTDGEVWEIDGAGRVTRYKGGALRWSGSDKWVITGAVAYTPQGGVERHYTLAELLADPAAIPWRFKNGKPKTFLRDLDHGTAREQRGPTVTQGWVP